MTHAHRTFDPQCRVLAEHVVKSQPSLHARTDELAEELQQCVDDWLDWIRLLTERDRNGGHTHD